MQHGCCKNGLLGMLTSLSHGYSFLGQDEAIMSDKSNSFALTVIKSQNMSYERDLLIRPPVLIMSFKNKVAWYWLERKFIVLIMGREEFQTHKNKVLSLSKTQHLHPYTDDGWKQVLRLSFPWKGTQIRTAAICHQCSTRVPRGGIKS